jgi:hypothetical protein
LSGAVLAPLKRFVPFLLYRPSSLTAQQEQQVAAVSKTLTGVLAPLLARKIDSRAKLLAVWQKEPDFFKKEYLSWIQPSQHRDIHALWPPVGKASSSKAASRK